MKNKHIIYRRNPVYKKCPSCSSYGTLRRSHSRSTGEKIIKMLPFVGTYRCRECGWRGYLFNFSLSSKSIRTLFLYILIILITVFIASRVLRLLL